MVKPMTKTPREIHIRVIPQPEPGVPGKMACGGYRVQPEPVGPPGVKKLASNSSTAKR